MLKNYDVTFEHVRDISDLEESFNSFINLHQKRWEEKGNVGSFTLMRKK
ncbi:MAG: hypothetical protein KAR07_03175 [Spirochaetes bacterium]|nr:hypothetical protein [Spirochaetota bacterium]